MWYCLCFFSLLRTSTEILVLIYIPDIPHCRQILYHLRHQGSPYPTCHVWLFVTPWTIQSMEFSRSENTRVGNISLLQEIFPTQGSNPDLPHCRCILYQLSHKGSPRILEWVAYPFCSGSSQPRNWTGVSCIAEGFFTWVIREVPSYPTHIS